MRKNIIIIVVVLVIAGAAAYFLFLQPPPEPETMFYSPGESFVTNIKDSVRLLKTAVVLELITADTEKVTEYLTENNHVIRDIILSTLRNKNEEELRAQDIQDELREEIKASISDKMGIDYLQKVYFNDFVIQ